MFALKRPFPTITVHTECFMVGNITVPWHAISLITTYKLDLITYDLLCFGIQVDGSSKTIELSEDWAGFEALSKELDSRFNFPDDWSNSVIHPAFKTNQTTLYTRA